MTMKKMLVAMLCVCFLALSATACDVENFDDAEKLYCKAACLCASQRLESNRYGGKAA